MSSLHKMTFVRSIYRMLKTNASRKATPKANVNASPPTSRFPLLLPSNISSPNNSKTRNSSCHLCNNTAITAQYDLVLDCLKCLRVYCMRPNCMKKLRLDSLEQFKSFKQGVDEGLTEFICPHCTDNTTCIGAACRSSRKSRKVNSNVCLCVCV